MPLEACSIGFTKSGRFVVWFCIRLLKVALPSFGRGEFGVFTMVAHVMLHERLEPRRHFHTIGIGFKRSSVRHRVIRPTCGTGLRLRLIRRLLQNRTAITVGLICARRPVAQRFFCFVHKFTWRGREQELRQPWLRQQPLSELSWKGGKSKTIQASTLLVSPAPSPRQSNTRQRRQGR